MLSRARGPPPLRLFLPEILGISTGAPTSARRRHQPGQRKITDAQQPRAAFASTSELHEALSVSGGKSFTIRCRKNLRDALSVRI